jgi:hypothetical protein
VTKQDAEIVGDNQKNKRAVIAETMPTTALNLSILPQGHGGGPRTF